MILRECKNACRGGVLCRNLVFFWEGGVNSKHGGGIIQKPFSVHCHGNLKRGAFAGGWGESRSRRAVEKFENFTKKLQIKF